MDRLDGNAIAGTMFEVFGQEMTTAVGTCAGCGRVGPLAEVAVYLLAPGVVARCPNCNVSLTLHQELAVHLRGVVQVNVKRLRRNVGPEDDVADLVLQRRPLRARAARQERIAGDVARQPNPRGNDDFAHRPAAAEPFAGVTREIG